MVPRGPVASLLLAVGVSSAIIGPVNTFIRTGAAIRPPPRWISRTAARHSMDRGGGESAGCSEGHQWVRRSTVSLAGYPPPRRPSVIESGLAADLKQGHQFSCLWGGGGEVRSLFASLEPVTL